jgi:hypothetical protein
MRSNSPAARAAGSGALSSRGPRSSVSSTSGSGTSGPRFPADLTFNGGPVVAFAQSHAIYMNPVSAGFPNGACAAITNCWGDPEAFLKDLAASDFIHITDQYVNSHADNRYTVGQSAMINYFQTQVLFDSQILANVHAVAAATGQTGYGHIYHVFLPPGQDVCAPGVGCASTTICAYHGSADFFDLGHVLYSVEPDQLSFGCSIAPGSPNGARADSINNVLSHELFEIVTDPDFDAWFNSNSAVLFEDEIGDECEFFIPGFFDVPTFKINKNLYAVQSEYDNKQHACVTKSF